MVEPIVSFVRARDERLAYEDEHLDDSPLQEALSEADYYAWYALSADEKQKLHKPEHIIIGPNDACLTYLRGLLSSEDWVLRCNGAQWLGEVVSEQVVEPLIAARADDNPYVRRSAVRSLGLIGAPAALGPVGAMIDDSDAGVRRTAIFARTKIAALRIPEELSIGANKPYESFLRGALNHEYAAVRRHAAGHLRVVGTPEATPALLARLNDPDNGVRYAVALALGEVGHSTAIAVLTPLLNDLSSHVNTAAWNAINRINVRHGNVPNS